MFFGLEFAGQTKAGYISIGREEGFNAIFKPDFMSSQFML